jgi:N-acetylglutamate synthase-like GNAT family acetyltransferase
MLIERATIHDAEDILKLQKLAFQSQAKLYDDHSLPPLIQSLEDIKADFKKQVFLKASIDGKIIGSVRAHMEQDTCFIERLVVHPDHQNHGLGTRLMNEMEKHFSDARSFELFTGHKSEKSIYFYQKLGYRIFRSEEIKEGLTLLHMKVIRQ